MATLWAPSIWERSTQPSKARSSGWQEGTRAGTSPWVVACWGLRSRRCTRPVIRGGRSGLCSGTAVPAHSNGQPAADSRDFPVPRGRAGPDRGDGWNRGGKRRSRVLRAYPAAR
jgi:hypothetical protein